MVDSIKSKTALETYAELTRNPSARLIDVRTNAEWAFIGVPDIPNLITIMWQDFPNCNQNLNFIEQLSGQGVGQGDRIYLLCRSGVRSLHAAHALLAAGFTDLTNVSDGFEGDLDNNCHRNTTNGWRCSGLPWKQS